MRTIAYDGSRIYASIDPPIHIIPTGFDPKIHHRHFIRLKGYDYSGVGAYFVTIVAFQRECLFGEIVNGEMQLNELGNIVAECWQAIPSHFPDVELSAYVVMPNHVHGMIIIRPASKNGTATNPSPSVGARHASPLRPQGASPQSVGAIIGSFKPAVTKRIGRESIARPVWQRNYYEHIIRNEKEMENIWKYIDANPSRWTEDEENLLRKT